MSGQGGKAGNSPRNRSDAADRGGSTQFQELEKRSGGQEQGNGRGGQSRPRERASLRPLFGTGATGWIVELHKKFLENGQAWARAKPHLSCVDCGETEPSKKGDTGTAQAQRPT